MLAYKQSAASVTLAQFVNTRPTSRWKAISAEPRGTIVFQWRPVSNRCPPSDSFIFIVTHYDTSATSVLIAKIHFDALCLSYPSNYCFYLSTSSAAAARLVCIYPLNCVSAQRSASCPTHRPFNRGTRHPPSHIASCFLDTAYPSLLNTLSSLTALLVVAFLRR